jgi:6-phosphogluconolactonase
MISEPRNVIAPSAGALAQQAADLVVESAENASSPFGMFTIALSGGSTPKSLFSVLASDAYRTRIPWDRTQVFFSDERFVAADSTESNFRMAHETLLSRVPIPERFVHQVPTVGMAPQECAAIYGQGVRRVFDAGETEVPRFDLILLGLGDDGHTASLFPGTEALGITDEIVVANHVDKLDTWRITFTYPLINAAKRVMFLVSGAAKAERVAEVRRGEDLPAAGVRPTDGELIWALDSDAAAGLNTAS